MEKRRITKEDRKVWHKNALLGTKTWENMSSEERKRKRHRKRYSEWGFEEHSPHTKERRLEEEAEALEHELHEHRRHLREHMKRHRRLVKV